jgi:two-component system, OmpR family, sensor histidine kinase MtrB
VRIGDELNVVVGWDLPGIGAYFEAFSLEEADSSLASVRLSLLLAAAITTGLGVLLGIFAARRAVRPVGTAAQAASAIAGGRLDTRLETTDDPDLKILTESFNDMAEALQLRVERDARFASDVSHELRSPLMTLSASVEVMQARRDELSERSRAALDLLASDVIRFQGLVEDLLEISRFDAGAIRLHMEELLAAEFVRQAVAVSSLPTTPVTVDERAEVALIRGDRRRLARVIANLIDNARAYGGGAPEVSISVLNPPDEADVAHRDRRRGPRPRRAGGGTRAGVRTICPRWRRRSPDRQRGRRTRALARRRARPDARRARVGRGSARRRIGARFVIELMAVELDE